MNNQEFAVFIGQKGQELYRDMPWREDTRPYYVLVSELMLQQTQVTRVLPKFAAFIAQFPDEGTLARASLAEVLRLWQGLGYNTRAKYVHQAAEMIIDEYGGVMPDTEKELLRLPGVGKNTAGAILAYSFNQPALFVETNIRTVYIHHFFADSAIVDDRAILEKLDATLDRAQPREFYWALMDYGAWLKAQGVKNNAQSKQYKKQSPLRGSLREMRGMIIRALSSAPPSHESLSSLLGDDPRLPPALDSLRRDRLIESVDGTWQLSRK